MIGARKEMAQKPHEPTDKSRLQAQSAAGLGLPHDQIGALLGISDEDADRRFGFFLTPFRYGAPPHGGFAFGLDRLVAILAGEENIREVIAFPKTQSGTDPMTNSPTPVDAKQLLDLGLRVLPKVE